MSNSYTYILKCADGSHYTGSTQDLELRLQQHQNGKGANYARKHLAVELVYFEEYQRIDDAFYREKQIQGWSRKKKEALINHDFSKLSHQFFGRPLSLSKGVVELIKTTVKLSHIFTTFATIKQKQYAINT